MCKHTYDDTIKCIQKHRGLVREVQSYTIHLLCIQGVVTQWLSAGLATWWSSVRIQLAALRYRFMKLHALQRINDNLVQGGHISNWTY